MKIWIRNLIIFVATWLVMLIIGMSSEAGGKILLIEIVLMLIEYFGRRIKK